jgi:hypothetical protein
MTISYLYATPPLLRQFVVVMVAFIENRMTPAEFSFVYMDLYLKNQNMWTNEVYEILNEVFYPVEEHDVWEDNPAVDQDMRQTAIMALSMIGRLNPTSQVIDDS